MGKTYIAHILEQVNAVTERCGPVLLYGENIDTGSRVAGLARGLKVNPAGRILNVGNCELTHIGLGLGIMLDGGQAVLFMKQLDFLLLGMDQMVNTFAVMRSCRPASTLGSFTIFVIVCDQGYQGPQSSLNAAGDFAAMANIDAYCLNGTEDVSRVVHDQFVAPGFRMVCVSQRLFGAPALDLPIEARAADDSMFKYRSGDDLTLLSYNFALRDTLALADRLRDRGIRSDVFHVNYVPAMKIDMLMESCVRTGRLVLIDDSKALTKFGDVVIADVKSRKLEVDVMSLGRRGCTPEEYGVTEDRFVPDADAVLSFATARLGQSLR